MLLNIDSEGPAPFKWSTIRPQRHISTTSHRCSSILKIRSPVRTLLITEQRLALAVRGLWLHNASEQDITVGVLRCRDIERSHEEGGKDDKSEDPLKRNDLDGELPQRESYSQGQ